MSFCLFERAVKVHLKWHFAYFLKWMWTAKYKGRPCPFYLAVHFHLIWTDMAKSIGFRRPFYVDVDGQCDLLVYDQNVSESGVTSTYTVYVRKLLSVTQMVCVHPVAGCVADLLCSLPSNGRRRSFLISQTHFPLG